MRDCLAKLGERKQEVLAVGVSGQQHGFVALDKKNKPIRPANLWCDTSTVRAMPASSRPNSAGPEGLIELAGNAILPGYTAPKILWLKEKEPKNYKALDGVLLPHDYINFHLTGERAMEYGDASGTGLMDVRTRKWCEPLIEFIDPELAERLPAIASSRRKPSAFCATACANRGAWKNCRW